jgi:hypothetical protein
MGIRFYCTDCGRRLNIKAFLAGKRGICPHCDARVQIPFESQIPADAPKYRPASAGKATVAQLAVPSSGDTEHEDFEQDDIEQDIGVPQVSADPIAEVPEAVWYVRPPSGGQYGPARGDVMRRWVDEGRVSSDSMVWREGWADWQTAGPVFPTLGDSQPVAESFDVGRTTDPAPSFLAANNVERSTAPGATEMLAGANRKKSLAPLIVLGLLIVVLLVVTVVVVVKTGA